MDEVGIEAVAQGDVCDGGTGFRTLRNDLGRERRAVGTALRGQGKSAGGAMAFGGGVGKVCWPDGYTESARSGHCGSKFLYSGTGAGDGRKRPK